LTGHLVLSTVHTNDASSTVNRLLDMGVEDYLLTSTVIGILAQRLVRKLCPNCKEPYHALPEVVEQLGLAKFADTRDMTLFHAKGCAHCGQTGYLGRFCILEAQRGGMLTMYEDGMRKAIRGDTTFEEVLRVTREA
jgi:general secretion pathway protein E